MGYQESYMRMSNSKDFDKLLNIIRKNGIDSFEEAVPVEIITLTKPIKVKSLWFIEPEEDEDVLIFEAGEKFIYVVGERSGQRDSDCFFKGCKRLANKYLNDLETTSLSISLRRKSFQTIRRKE